MNRKFALRLQMTPNTRKVSNPNKKAEASIARGNIKWKAEQTEQAVERCKNTVFSPISRHCWCKKKLPANWRCPPFGKYFNIGLNFKNKAFFYTCKV